MIRLTHMTGSIRARQRWAQSHATRARIVNSVLQDVEINKKDDVNFNPKIVTSIQMSNV